MKKLLLLQFRSDKSSQEEQESYERIALNDGTFSIDTLDALTESAEWSDPKELLMKYEGVIIGGSGEYHFTGIDNAEKEKEFTVVQKNVATLLQYIVAHDFPTLGVCLGHQMLAQFLGVKIIIDEQQAKVGSHELSLLDAAKDDPLFSGVPQSFVAQYGHKSCLSELPKDAILLASGPKCSYSAFRYKNNIYGVQFHPEMDRDDTILKLQRYPEYQKFDPHFVQNTKPTPFAPYIIRNFAKKAQKK